VLFRSKILRRERQAVQILDRLAPAVLTNLTVALVPDPRDPDVRARLPVVELLEQGSECALPLAEADQVDVGLDDDALRDARHVDPAEDRNRARRGLECARGAQAPLV